MKAINFTLLGVMAAAFVVVMVPSGGGLWLLFSGLFCLWPLGVHAGLVYTSRAFGAQATIASTSLLYAVWFAYIFMSATVWYPDPQSPILFVFTGIYAIPVLVPMWGLALWLNHR